MTTLPPSPSSFNVDLRSRPKLGFQVPNPPLFDDSSSSSKSNASKSQQLNASSRVVSNVNEAELHRLRQKKAWDLALAPAKQVPMQTFMMWMSGSGVQIFSVMMVYMLIKGAISAALSVNAAFQPFEPPPSTSASKNPRDHEPAYQLTAQKLAFIGCQSLLLGLGLWKVNGMGLLPTRMSDWIMYERRPDAAIRSAMDSYSVIVS